MSGELLDVHDNPAIHEARGIGPKHREKWRRVLVEKIDETRAVSAGLRKHRTRRARVVGERELHGDSDVGDVKLSIGFTQWKLHPGDLLLGDEEHFTVAQTERKEGRFVVKVVARLFRTGV